MYQKKLGLVASGLLVAMVACSSSSSNGNAQGGADAGAGEGGSTGPNVEEPPEPPHAEGTIILSEAHASTGGSSNPYVSVAFYPNDKARKRAKGCFDKIEGCEIARKAECTKAETSTGCPSGEACVFDDACAPICKKLCTKSCEDGQTCELDSAGEATCVDVETFDAGPISFVGTSSAISLFPPSYEYESKEKGAPFSPGSTVTAKAQGAAGAGFEAFEAESVGTTFIQTSPSIDKITKAQAFGAGSMPIGWVPGEDTVRIMVSSQLGSAICKVDDKKGSFDVPRAVIDAVVGDTGGSLSIAVTRVHEDIKKGLKSKGKLAKETIEPEAWIRMSTMSTESATIQGCGSGSKVCGDECVNVRTSLQHCGDCNKACPGECDDGVCLDCEGCLAKAQAVGGACKAKWDACQANAMCKDLETCVRACPANDATCVSNCRTQYAGGETLLDDFILCLRTTCAVDCKL